MRKTLLLIFILLVIFYFFQLALLARNYSQSHRFGDEDAHLVGGHFLLKGYKMYEDFSGNHQPINYIFPAFVQKIILPNSLYAFIGKHRQAIFFYSLIWNLIYLLTFGKVLFLFTTIFEICRYVLLGNKVLGEVLAMYPFIFLFGLAIKQSFFQKKTTIKEIVLFSLSTFIVTFSLLPLWPSVLILNAILILINKNKKKFLIWQIVPFIFLTLILFIFVPFKNFFRDTIIDNVLYVIPKMNKLSSNWDYLKMIVLPFTAFHSQPNFIEILTIGFLPLYGFVSYFIYKKKKIIPWFLILFALILSNNRTTELKYGNFHVLPWLAAYFFIPIAFFSFQKNLKIHFLIILLAIWVNIFGGKTDYYGLIMWNLKNDLATEHYINYSESVKYGLAIKAIKTSGDRLLALPNDTLVFWVAEVDLATRPLEAYDWQYDLPHHYKELIDVFKNHPPEFYLNHAINPLRGNSPLHQLILKNLKEKYVQINHLGKPSNLYLLKNKISKITDKQWENFEKLLFSRPQ